MNPVKDFMDLCLRVGGHSRMSPVQKHLTKVIKVPGRGKGEGEGGGGYYLLFRVAYFIWGRVGVLSRCVRCICLGLFQTFPIR